MMKKYLITGSGGFVAKHFLDYLESLRVPVSVLGVDIHPISYPLNYSFVFFSFQQIDLQNKELTNDILKEYKPDYLLHLASFSSVAYSWINPVAAFVNNSNIFLNLVDQVRLLKLNCRILSVGSSEEYGNISETELPVTEKCALRPSSPYAVARVSQEMLSEIYAKNYGIDIVLTRSFNHIGPGQKEVFVISSFAKKLAEIKKGLVVTDTIMTGNISVVRDFVDVRDVVKAYHVLLNKGTKGEIYNICSGKGNSLRAVLLKMMEIIDITLNISIDQLLVRPDDNKIIIGSNLKIYEDTGWRPSIPLETSLKDIIDYWMDNVPSS